MQKLFVLFFILGFTIPSSQAQVAKKEMAAIKIVIPQNLHRLLSTDLVKLELLLAAYEKFKDTETGQEISKLINEMGNKLDAKTAAFLRKAVAQKEVKKIDSNSDFEEMVDTRNKYMRKNMNPLQRRELNSFYKKQYFKKKDTQTFKGEPLSNIKSEKVIDQIKYDKIMLLKREQSWNSMRRDYRILLELEKKLNLKLTAIKKAKKKLEIASKEKEDTTAPINTLSQLRKDKKEIMATYDSITRNLSIDEKVELGKLRGLMFHKCFEDIPEGILVERV